MKAIFSKVIPVFDLIQALIVSIVNNLFAYNGTACLKNVDNCLNTNIYSYLETCGCQNSNLY